MNTDKKPEENTFRYSDLAEENFAYLKALSRQKVKLPKVPSSDSSIFQDDEEGRTFIDEADLVRFQNELEKDRSLFNPADTVHQRLDKCNFPNFRRKFMLSYDFKKVLKLVGFDISTKWDWIYIFGGKGVGKSTLACRLAWEWMKNNVSRKVNYISVSDWIQGLKRFNDEEGNTDLENLSNFVILDDIDKFYATEWQVDQLFRLIDHFYRKKTRLIITANIPLEHFTEAASFPKIGTLVDRIKERTKNAKVCINWESFR